MEQMGGEVSVFEVPEEKKSRVAGM